jgi:hypothetical protein
MEAHASHLVSDITTATNRVTAPTTDTEIGGIILATATSAQAIASMEGVGHHVDALLKFVGHTHATKTI